MTHCFDTKCPHFCQNSQQTCCTGWHLFCVLLKKRHSIYIFPETHQDCKYHTTFAKRLKRYLDGTSWVMLRRKVAVRTLSYPDKIARSS